MKKQFAFYKNHSSSTMEAGAGIKLGERRHKPGRPHRQEGQWGAVETDQKERSKHLVWFRVFKLRFSQPDPMPDTPGTPALSLTVILSILTLSLSGIGVVQRQPDTAFGRPLELTLYRQLLSLSSVSPPMPFSLSAKAWTEQCFLKWGTLVTCSRSTLGAC